MTSRSVGWQRRLVRFLSSKWFWRFVMGLFVVQAVWLACSAAYPMAFDERYHFGLIQLHARQWLPFFTSQPPTGQYGAVVRDPSYLYHWLMSFPYRVVMVFAHDQTIQIIVLRLINVALFVYALVLYRRLMRRLGLGNAFAHAALLVFTLIPVVPFLAATINYDNLLMVVVPWGVLLTLDVLDAFAEHRMPLGRLLMLTAMLLLGSLIKYPFLPVLAVTVLFLLWRAWCGRLLTAKIWRSAWRVFRRTAGWRQLLVVALVLAAAGLFAERYAVNIVQYHTPVPACNQVISQDECLEYGPWGRDYSLASIKPANFHPEPLIYTGTWLHGMWYRLFFAIGPEPAYHNNPPLFVISRVAIGAAALLGLGIALRFRRLFTGHPERLLVLLLMAGYGLALFVDNYAEYLQTSLGMAINGRYWVPFLPIFFALGGLAWLDILRRAPGVKHLAALLVLAAFLLQGGGAVTYIVRSDNSWYWPNATVRRLNGDIRALVSPFIYGKDLPRSG